MVNDPMVNIIMKKNYIQPVVMAQFLQGMHVICSSPEPEISGGNEPADPNNVEIF